MENLNFFHTIFDNINVGVIVSNKKGEFIYVNSHQVSQSSFTHGEYMKLSAQELYNNKITDTCIFDMVIENKREIAALQKTCPNGDTMYERLVIGKPIFDADGEIEYVVSTYIDLDMFRDNYSQALLSREISVMPHKDEKHGDIVYKSNAMKKVLDTALSVAVTDTSILICGESGTGKEVLANYIHNRSKRATKEFVAINCASLPQSLLEAELFGYEKGSFTGAASGGKQGIIELAAGGTLFLDEINSLPLDLQGKLLRVLETKKLKRIGSLKETAIDFRLLSASNEILQGCIERGTFRADLYYRIGVVPIIIPPLRERREDIIPLCKSFLKQFNEKYGKIKMLSEEAYTALKKYDWPGNVRELKNLMERLIVTSSYATSEINAIPKEMFDCFLFTKPMEHNRTDESNPENGAQLQVDIKSIVEALKRNDCNREKAALDLDISRRTLQYKIKRHNITTKATNQIYVNDILYKS